MANFYSDAAMAGVGWHEATAGVDCAVMGCAGGLALPRGGAFEGAARGTVPLGSHFPCYRCSSELTASIAAS